ncbi:unnamed protein product, partial [marine sediment metagenome]
MVLGIPDEHIPKNRHHRRQGIGKNPMSRVTFKEQAAPDTPASGYVVIYAKADGLLYFKDDAGVESAVKGGMAATDIDTLAKLNGVVTDATLVDTDDIVLIAATSLAAAGFFLDED